MTTAVLEKAFKMASGFSEKEQEIIASHWIEEMNIPNFIERIKDDLNWEKSFSETQNVLEMMAENALAQIRDGKAEQTGWDEL